MIFRFTKSRMNRSHCRERAISAAAALYLMRFIFPSLVALRVPFLCRLRSGYGFNIWRRKPHLNLRRLFFICHIDIAAKARHEGEAFSMRYFTKPQHISEYIGYTPGTPLYGRGATHVWSRYAAARVARRDFIVRVSFHQVTAPPCTTAIIICRADNDCREYTWYEF